MLCSVVCRAGKVEFDALESDTADQIAVKINDAIVEKFGYLPFEAIVSKNEKVKRDAQRIIAGWPKWKREISL